MVKYLVFLTSLALAGCSAGAAARTELLLVADTDIPRIDRIEFRIEGPGKKPQRAEARVSESSPAPHSLGVLYTGGSLEPLTLTATGYDGTELVVSRQARVAFVKGKTRIVPLHLSQVCDGAPACKEAGFTCTERGCESATLDGDELDDWAGELPELPKPARDGGGPVMDGGMTSSDAGPPDAGKAGVDASVDAGMTPIDAGMMPIDAGMTPIDAGVPDAGSVPDGGFVCSTTQLDCEPLVPGCETDTTTSKAHCSKCGKPCNGVLVCTDSKCGPP